MRDLNKIWGWILKFEIGKEHEESDLIPNNLNNVLFLEIDEDKMRNFKDNMILFPAIRNIKPEEKIPDED